MTKDDPAGDKPQREQTCPTPDTGPQRNRANMLRRLSPLMAAQQPSDPPPEPPVADEAYTYVKPKDSSLFEQIKSGLELGLALVPSVMPELVGDVQESRAPQGHETLSLYQSIALSKISSQLSAVKQSLAALIQRLRQGGDPDMAAHEMQGVVKGLAELSVEHKRILEEAQIEKAYEAAWARLNEVRKEKAEKLRRLTQSEGSTSGRERVESLLELAFALLDAIG